MATTAANASTQRPTLVSRTLDGSRHRRLVVVVVAIGVAIALSFFLGRWRRDNVFLVDTNVYVASAGLFIVALAVERLNELLIAPWVGRGDTRIDRGVVIGSLSLVIGVVISGVLGLQILALLEVDAVDGDGWWWRNIAPAIETFATGLAVSAGAKPLHDLITKLDKNVAAKKASVETGKAPPAPTNDLMPSGSGGVHRLGLAVKLPERIRYEGQGDKEQPQVTIEAVTLTIKRLLPAWKVDADSAGSLLVHCTTADPPGSSAYLGQAFSAAHRLHGVGFEVTVQPAAVRPRATSIAATTPRSSLELLGVDVGVQVDGKGGKDVVVAVLDTGVREHPDGVVRVPIPDIGDTAPRVRILQGSDVVDSDDDPTDPLLASANWIDLDLMGSPGHGTGTAATIGAGWPDQPGEYTPEWWNQTSMIGVAPEAVVIPIRVMRGPVHLLDDDVAKGVDLAIEHNCHVLSMSLGGLAFRDLGAAIDRAVKDGIIVVCAAGNEFGVVVEPASYPNTIAVASVDTNGQPFFDGSSRGPEVTVSAPGLHVLRPDFEGTEHKPVLDYGTGTTYATAHVAGVAALWLAKHTRERLLDAYPGERLSQLFAHVLGATADAWSDADLAADWGPGKVNAKKVLEFPVFEGNRPAVPDRQLDAVFARKGAIAVSSRFAGGIASVLTAQGSTELRYNLFSGLLGLRRRIAGERSKAASLPDTDPKATVESGAALLRAEMTAQAGANPNFRRALESTTSDLPVPAGATPELKLVIDETNRTGGPPSDGPPTLPDDWGEGLSVALKRALQGRSSNMVRGFRWVGMAALLVALAVIAIAYAANAPKNPSAAAVTSAVGLLGIGLYGGAQAIERMLEFTVARVVFKDVPGRESDRALILLGIGILIGSLAAVALHVGLLQQVATNAPGDAWYRSADALITGLALGGGAKPLHDLLTRIRLSSE